MKHCNLYNPFVSIPNVTDNGEAVEESRATTQAISYIPYGEVFVEQQAGGWSSPYLFNAKELDSETGLYYYGARYLDPSDAMWLSVDPLWEKYVGMTPYGYCAGNPVKLVDVDGRELGVSDDGEYVQYNPNIKENQYNGNNKFIKNGFSILNKINSVKIGHKMLMALHKSEKKYLITNKQSKLGTMKIKPTYDENKNLNGANVYSSNKISLLGASHELFHCYQYEMGQGGASIWNEVEAYAFSNRLVNDYNDNLPYDAPLNSYEFDDSFCVSREGKENSHYKTHASNLTNGPMYKSEDFFKVIGLFKDCSVMNMSGIYDNYENVLSTNKKCLIEDFYK